MVSILTVNQLCEVLQAHRSTIYQYCREEMPYFRVGKESRFVLDEVVLWLKSRRKKTKNPPSKSKIGDKKVKRLKIRRIS